MYFPFYEKQIKLVMFLFLLYGGKSIFCYLTLAQNIFQIVGRKNPGLWGPDSSFIVPQGLHRVVIKAGGKNWKIVAPCLSGTVKSQSTFQLWCYLQSVWNDRWPLIILPAAMIVMTGPWTPTSQRSTQHSQPSQSWTDGA